MSYLHVTNLTGTSLVVSAHGLYANIPPTNPDMAPYSIDVTDVPAVRMATQYRTKIVKISDLSADIDANSIDDQTENFYVSVGYVDQNGNDVFQYGDGTDADVPSANVIVLGKNLRAYKDKLDVITDIITNPLFIAKRLQNTVHTMMIRRDVLMILIFIVLIIIISVPVVYSMKGQ